MNTQLQELAHHMVDCFEPNDIALAFAIAYHTLSRDTGQRVDNRKTFKKAATQFSRVNGLFLTPDGPPYTFDYATVQENIRMTNIMEAPLTPTTAALVTANLPTR